MIRRRHRRVADVMRARVVSKRPGKAPAAPVEARNRVERLPHPEHTFPRRPGETAYGPSRKPVSVVMDCVRALHAPSNPNEVAE
jgi:hypothetical protein